MTTGNRQKRAERLQLMLTLDEVDAVETWRFEHRMPSRSAAVRALMNLGLRVDTDSGAPEEMTNQHISSSDVGVVQIDGLVDRALGQVSDRKSVAIVGSDALIAHGLKSILSDAGYRIDGPISEIETAADTVKRRLHIAIVFDVAELSPENVRIAEALSKKELPLVICMNDDQADRLPDILRPIPVVSRLSAPEVLSLKLQDLLGQADR